MFAKVQTAPAYLRAGVHDAMPCARIGVPAHAPPGWSTGSQHRPFYATSNKIVGSIVCSFGVVVALARAVKGNVASKVLQDPIANRCLKESRLKATTKKKADLNSIDRQ